MFKRLNAHWIGKLNEFVRCTCTFKVMHIAHLPFHKLRSDVRLVYALNMKMKNNAQCKNVLPLLRKMWQWRFEQLGEESQWMQHCAYCDSVFNFRCVYFWLAQSNHIYLSYRLWSLNNNKTEKIDYIYKCARKLNIPRLFQNRLHFDSFHRSAYTESPKILIDIFSDVSKNFGSKVDGNISVDHFELNYSLQRLCAFPLFDSESIITCITHTLKSHTAKKPANQPYVHHAAMNFSWKSLIFLCTSSLKVHM